MSDNSVKWCACGEYPERMCNQWPACVDINGALWGADERFHKYRRKNFDKLSAADRRSLADGDTREVGSGDAPEKVERR